MFVSVLSSGVILLTNIMLRTTKQVHNSEDGKLHVRRWVNSSPSHRHYYVTAVGCNNQHRRVFSGLSISYFITLGGGRFVIFWAQKPFFSPFKLKPDFRITNPHLKERITSVNRGMPVYLYILITNRLIYAR